MPICKGNTFDLGFDGSIQPVVLEENDFEHQKEWSPENFWPSQFIRITKRRVAEKIF